MDKPPSIAKLPPAAWKHGDPCLGDLGRDKHGAKRARAKANADGTGILKHLPDQLPLGGSNGQGPAYGTIDEVALRHAVM